MSITLTLPYPISANRYWKSFTNPKTGRAVTIVSDEAKTYKAEVKWLCHQAGIKTPFPHRVQIHLDLYPQKPQDVAKRIKLKAQYWDDDVRCIDLDNARKVLFDAFKGVLYADDKWVWKDSAERMEPDGEARVVVTIEEYTKPALQPALFEAHS